MQAVVRKSNMTTQSHQMDILQKALVLIAIVTNYRLTWNTNRKERTSTSNSYSANNEQCWHLTPTFRKEKPASLQETRLVFT